MRSDRIAHNGIAASARMLVQTSKVSMLVRGMCTVLTAYDKTNTPKIVLTTDTSAAKMTLTTSGVWLLNSSAIGILGVSWLFASCSNAGVSGSVRRTQNPTAT